MALDDPGAAGRAPAGRMAAGRGTARRVAARRVTAGPAPARRQTAGPDSADRGVARPPVRPPADVLRILGEGELEIVGRLVDASNAVLYCRVRGAGPGGAEATLACVYKPVRGERPLWDFPVGTLANRERAAYLVSEAAGWAIAPPTVLRDGPFGRGMVQLWVEVDETADVVDMVRRSDRRLRRIALFDAVVNNADRKGGHLLPVRGGHVHGVDHGICFAVEPKLRTVLWGWRGRPLGTRERATLERLRTALDGELGAGLRELLSRREVDATSRRIDDLLATGRFPEPDPGRPVIPWPPF